MLNQFSRTQLLLGADNMDRLSNAKVAVFGIGGELLFDIADPRSEFESEIIHKFYMEDFKAQLPGVDRKILQMRYDGHSLKEIAAAVGFKTPSAVSKHVEKIAERYDNFISDEYGKLLSKCIN